MAFHGVHSLPDGIFLAAHLAVGNDASLVVQPHNRADVQHGGDGRRRAGHASAAAVKLQLRGEKLVMDLMPVFQRPLRRLFDRTASIAHIGHGIHQKPVARRTAQRIHNHKLARRIFFPQPSGRQHGVADGLGHAASKRKMQHVAALQQVFKILFILKFVDLRSRREFPCRQKFIKTRKRRRIAAHIVCVLRSVHRIGVKQNRDFTHLRVGIGQING